MLFCKMSLEIWLSFRQVRALRTQILGPLSTFELLMAIERAQVRVDFRTDFTDVNFLLRNRHFNLWLFKGLSCEISYFIMTLLEVSVEVLFDFRLVGADGTEKPGLFPTFELLVIIKRPPMAVTSRANRTVEFFLFQILRFWSNFTPFTVLPCEMSIDILLELSFEGAMGTNKLVLSTAFKFQVTIQGLPSLVTSKTGWAVVFFLLSIWSKYKLPLLDLL